jgi:pilus assembly protein CpaB
MRLVTVIIIVIALSISGVTAFLLLRFIQQQTPEKIVEHEVIAAERVLVAKIPLRVGVVLKQDDHFEWRAWPKDGIAPGYVLESSGIASRFIGAAVIRDVVLGEPITANKVIRPGEQSMLSVLLTPGYRAATAPVNVQVGVAGFVSPGDRVDLILITGVDTIVPEARPRGEVEERRRLRQFGEVILADLRVLAIDQSVQNLGTGTRIGKAITFEVTPKQAEILAIARTIGELYLVLRSQSRPEQEAPPREFPFTSELEILTSIRANINEAYVASLFPREDPQDEATEPLTTTPVVTVPPEPVPPTRSGTSVPAAAPTEPEEPKFEEVTITRGAESETVRFPVEEVQK